MFLCGYFLSIYAFVCKILKANQSVLPRLCSKLTSPGAPVFVSLASIEKILNQIDLFFPKFLAACGRLTIPKSNGQMSTENEIMDETENSNSSTNDNE